MIHVTQQAPVCNTWTNKKFYNMAIHTTWRTYGPFSEDLTRKTVGRLLGESYPVSDVYGYLDALRLAAHSLK